MSDIKYNVYHSKNADLSVVALITHKAVYCFSEIVLTRNIWLIHLVANNGLVKVEIVENIYFYYYFK